MQGLWIPLVGGAAAWEGLRWEALSLSDGRAMW